MENNVIILHQREAAAAYIRDIYKIRCKASTLAKFVTNGGGPLYRRSGNTVLYEQADLDAWAQERLSPKFHSSAEYPAYMRQKRKPHKF